MNIRKSDIFLNKDDMNGYKIIKQIHMDQVHMFIKFMIKEQINIMPLRYLDLIKTITKP